MPQEDILSIIEEAIQRYRPEGEFAKGRAEQLTEAKAQFVPEARAELVSRGLAGTTMGAAIPARFERTVAKPWRTQTEMLRGGSLMESIMAKAGMMERAEARKAGEALTREQMELQRQLEQGRITSQQYMQKMQLAQQEQLAGERAGLSREEMALQKLLAERGQALTKEQMEMQRELALAELRSREGIAARGAAATRAAAGGVAGGGARRGFDEWGTTDTGGYGGDFGGAGAGYDKDADKERGQYGEQGFGGIPEGVMIGGEMFAAGTYGSPAMTQRIDEGPKPKGYYGYRGIDVGEARFI